MPTAHGRRTLVPALLASLILASCQGGSSTGNVTTPEQFFGHQIGADYVLPNYTKYSEFITKLDSESDRLKVVEIGKTAEGRPQLMAIITSPQNHAKLERYREISGQLARAEGLTDEQARELAAEGKAVVWIDGGLHSTEVLGPQQLTETIYQLVSRDDAETKRILDDVIVLAVHANPDGMELVSDWYMREPDSLKRNSGDIPRLYQKYIGHDNNRDFYMSTQPETENMNRQLFHEWHPQIMYNHHQTGPTGTVMFAPPFRDPFNYVFDPLIVTGLDVVGSAMHNRFIAEGKPGVTMRRGANYSTWWNGGLRTVTYFHNMIGLLTETIGNPTPMEIPFLPDRQLPNADLPAPIEPQTWHFRNSVDYSVTANYAVLDLASRYKDTFLYNRYQMGRNSIQRGSEDSWTTYPSRVDATREAMRKDAQAAGGSGVMAVGGISRSAPGVEDSKKYLAMMRDPAARDARGYVLPSDQADFPTAVRFINAMLENGIDVLRASEPFEAGGKTYPAGSLVIKTAQAFRPHIIDMFEPQDHPNDFLYPGGPPIPPYDAAGWTLAYQMGIDFDRILDGFDGNFEKITDWNIKPPAGTVASGASAGYTLSPSYVDGYAAVVKLMGQGETVYRLKTDGTYYIPGGSETQARLEAVANELGVSFEAAASRPEGVQMKMNPTRIALWDNYGGSMPSGWTRWILEQNGIPFDVVYPQTFDAGDLHSKYDVIVFVGGAISAPGGGGRGFGGRQPSPESIPAEYRDRLGSITAEKTVPQLKQFLEDGGTILTIGSSTSLAQYLGLPIRSKLVDADGTPLKGEEYYIPGSVLATRVDTTQPIAFGMNERTDVFFNNSPVFALGPDAAARGIKRVAWYDSATPLRSGWAWGQKYLEGGAAVVQAPVGKGMLYLFGPEIIYRAQPYGTFKYFFNGLANSTATEQAIQ